MSDLSNYSETRVFNALFRGTDLTAAAAVYLALVTAITDAEAGTFTEVSTAGTDYIRKECTVSAPTDGAATLAADVDYDVAAGDWGDVIGGVIMDAETGGNPITIPKLFTGSVVKTVGIGDQLSVPAANLTLSIA